jgi:hypothetical protein
MAELTRTSELPDPFPGVVYILLTRLRSHPYADSPP